MGRSNSRKKAKHDRRRAHQRQQADKKRKALAEAEHEARYIGKDGQTLKRERTGQAYQNALVAAMKERGYVLEERTRKVLLPKEFRTPGVSGKMTRYNDKGDLTQHGTQVVPVRSTTVREMVWVPA